MKIRKVAFAASVGAFISVMLWIFSMPVMDWLEENQTRDVCEQLLRPEACSTKPEPTPVGSGEKRV